ncbi:hypothetical protein ACRAWF_24245 [Streptomyces sp. L7]
MRRATARPPPPGMPHQQQVLFARLRSWPTSSPCPRTQSSCQWDEFGPPFLAVPLWAR